MIDYEVLCQTIEDWRAGRRPSIDLSATPAPAEGYASAEEAYEVDAEAYDEQGEHAEPGYEEHGEYAEPGYEEHSEYAEPGEYDQYGAPDHVEAGGTSPVDLAEVEPPPYAEGEEEPESVSLADDDY